MKRRKLLYLVNYDVSIPLTGAPLRSGEIIRFLSGIYDVYVVGMAGCAHPPGDVEAGYKRDGIGAMDGLMLKTDVAFSKFGHFVYSRFIYSEAKKLMEKIGFDLIIADYLSCSLYGYLLSRRYHVPWVYSSHNVEYLRFFYFARDDFKRYFMVPYYYLIERIGARADMVIAISEEDAKIFRKWVDPARLVVVPQGFDEKTYYPNHPRAQSEKPIVLFYGNFNHLPNRQAAMITCNQILPAVLKRVPEAVFRFVGASPPPELNHPNLETPGFVEDLAEQVHQAAVVIAPIMQGGGMRTKIIESLACGKVVISTRKGAEWIPDVYGNLIVTEVEDFPRRICSLLESADREYHDDYEKLKHDFSWKSVLPRMKEKIDSVVFAGGIS